MACKLVYGAHQLTIHDMSEGAAAALCGSAMSQARASVLAPLRRSGSGVARHLSSSLSSNTTDAATVLARRRTNVPQGSTLRPTFQRQTFAGLCELDHFSWTAVPLGTVMRGGGIARVLESRADGFQPGELVQARLGWQTHPTIPAKYLQKIDLAQGDALAWIGPLGLSAVTAYFGMRDIGAVKPGDRVLVSRGEGGVGQIATQTARIEVCHVVGIARGTAKCALLSNELRLDGVIDYKAAPDLATAIGRACPDGIDLYFDNVGGPTLDAALLHLRDAARSRSQETFGCFIHTADPRSALEVTEDEREAFWEKLYGEPGFGIWMGNFRDILLDRKANRLISDFVARKTRERVNVEGNQVRRIMRYSGGHPKFREHCEAAAANGYRELALA